MAKRKESFRIERDPLGLKKVPAKAYYGVQTRRAMENFPISGIRPKEAFIKATGMVKLAAAEANSSLGLLKKRISGAIIRAAKEVIAGKLNNEFVVDVYQAGAGTSHNMNANEVIANRAIEMLGGKRGDYSLVHPNDHVNMAQSTNDTFPTAMRIAALISSEDLFKSLGDLERELKRKSKQFDRIIKSARTHLQDAVPIRLGQDFSSYASSIGNCVDELKTSREKLKKIGLGGTAAGTGLNTHPRYRREVVKNLSRISGIKGLKPAPDPVEALNSMADFAYLSSALKNTAIELIRIANDFRLLSSGPNTGLSEITLPPVQPGSSIMPGKVNPVMAEMLNMVCFQVVGNDLAVTMAAQAGQFELNVMGPVINYNILQSVEILTTALRAFTDRCVKGTEANRKRCEEYFEKSVGLATVLNPFIGYEKAASVAKEAARTSRTIKEVTLEKGILTEKEWKKLFEPGAVTGPRDVRKLALGRKRTKAK